MDCNVGEIHPLPYSFIPMYLANCDGSTLSVAQHAKLFSLIEIAFGGDGKTTFRLPDLRANAVVGVGLAPNGIIKWPLGSTNGSETTALNIGQTPIHNHIFSQAQVASTASSPTQGAYLAQMETPGHLGAPRPNAIMAPTAFTSVGNGIPHENRQPYLSIGMFIVTEGNYPIFS